MAHDTQLTRTGGRQLVDVGAIVEGTVEKVTEYGAFVKLDSGENGMVHISQIDVNYVRNIHDFVREGDRVTVKYKMIATSIETKETKSKPEAKGKTEEKMKTEAKTK